MPERLLLAHARGEVLFVCGAGISCASGLPDFRTLVVGVYRAVDPAAHNVLETLHTAPTSGVDWRNRCRGLTDQQCAELGRFVQRDYDVVLGMLERRIDGSNPRGRGRVRKAVADCLQGRSPSRIHRDVARLAETGGVFRVATTNFDLLLERARRPRPATFSVASIPRPTMRPEFSGVFHIHGALPHATVPTTDLVLTDQDFGDAYLRRRVVGDFIYDAARIFNLVLVGYSADDPPMRYLLNAIAGDSSHFADLKERFSFVGQDAYDNVELEDWRSRGITPVPYAAGRDHRALLDVFDDWVRLAPAAAAPAHRVHPRIRGILNSPRHRAPEADRDFFDHLVRRGSTEDRLRIARLARRSRADLGWLDAIQSVVDESAVDEQ